MTARPSVGLFRPYESKSTTSTPEVSDPEPIEETPKVGKGAPTPSRKSAEAARRERLNPVLSPKEAKARERRISYENRNKSSAALESRPERVLLRDYIDSRWTVAEFLLPIMLVVLAISFLGASYPAAVVGATFVAYGLLALTVFDMWRLWRGYKQELAKRFPKSSPRGLLMVAFNRAMSIRRFRTPPPRISRGDSF